MQNLLLILQQSRACDYSHDGTARITFRENGVAKLYGVSTDDTPCGTGGLVMTLLPFGVLHIIIYTEGNAILRCANISYDAKAGKNWHPMPTCM